MSISSLEQEQKVSNAFSKQSNIFDQIDIENKLIVWVRKRVHKEVLLHLNLGDHLLELNCGTGIDALYFAQKGIKVTATDNADGMLHEFSKKVESQNLNDRISIKKCSFNELEQLGELEKFDYVFSNFGGLNCSNQLGKILNDIDNLLKPGGKFTLVIMPKFCLWEIIFILKGRLNFAFRRFRENGTSAHIEGVYFDCFYYSPNFINKQLKENFKLLSLKGLSIFVPPPFIEHFIERHPKLFRFLESIENKTFHLWPFRSIGDHYMITMEKKKLQ